MGEKIQGIELWRNKAEEFTSLVDTKEINLSHQPLIWSHSLPWMEDVLHWEIWVSFTVAKINLELYTILPQTLRMFILEATVYDFLYKVTTMVTTRLSCMAYIKDRHNIPVPEGTRASNTTSVLWNANP